MIYLNNISVLRTRGARGARAVCANTLVRMILLIALSLIVVSTEARAGDKLTDKATDEEQILGIGDKVNVDLPILTLTVGTGEIEAELAATPSARQVGLSGRKTLGENSGMLLMVTHPQGMCLWMRRVYFPLDAAFIDESGKVVHIAHMQKHTENIHCPPSPICYALETSAGWLAKHEVTVGLQVAGFESRPADSPHHCGGGIDIVAE